MEEWVGSLMAHSWKTGWKSGWGDSSLVPTPREREEGKGPGYHCSRMRLIAVNFHRLRGPWTNVCTPINVKTYTQRFVVRKLTHAS